MSPDLQAATELGYAQAMAQVMSLIAAHAHHGDSDPTTLAKLMIGIDAIRQTHLKGAAS